MKCRFCRGTLGESVVDMGLQPACDFFPPASAPENDPMSPVRVWICSECHLVQLAEGVTALGEVRGVESAAMAKQAEAAVARLDAMHLLPHGGSVFEYPSPHGGSWMSLLAEYGVRPASAGKADVVLDCFGLMHEFDLRTALSSRVRNLAADGILILQYHSLAAVVERAQWNSFQHGHPVYLSTPAIVGLLRTVGLEAVHARRFELNGGTVLLVARRGGRADASVRRLIDAEHAIGVCEPGVLRGLQAAASDAADSLRQWLVQARSEGRTVFGYGAAARAVPLLNHAGIGPELLPAVVDASPAKAGRRVPGVRIPIVSADELAARAPDDVLLFVPDLLDEVRTRFAPLAERMRWAVAEPSPRVVETVETSPMISRRLA